MKTMRRNAAPSAATTGMAKPATLLIAGSFLGLALAGCGSGDDAPPTGPPDKQLLSYAPIAGVWVGEISETDPGNAAPFPARLTLGESAAKDDSVGASQFGASGQVPDCGGTLLALEADTDNRVYEVRSVITRRGTPCSSGKVRLSLDPQASSLFFEYFINGERTSTGGLSRE